MWMAPATCLVTYKALWTLKKNEKRIPSVQPHDTDETVDQPLQTSSMTRLVDTAESLLKGMRPTGNGTPEQSDLKFIIGAPTTAQAKCRLHSSDESKIKLCAASILMTNLTILHVNHLAVQLSPSSSCQPPGCWTSIDYQVIQQRAAVPYQLKSTFGSIAANFYNPCPTLAKTA